jgi:Family of unknown function (DUF6580)
MVYLIIFLAVLSRFIPHIWNFSPVYGALLFGGAYLKKRESVWYPLLLLCISDFVLTNLIYGLHTGWGEIIQLAAFASLAVIGWSLRSRLTLQRFSFVCFAGPTAFFFISNFGVWLGMSTYPPTLSGLVACYVAGIPFYGYSVASTVAFAALLFGVNHLYTQRARQITSQA